MIDLGDYDNGNQSDESNSKSNNTQSDNKKKKKLNHIKKDKIHYNEDEEVVSSSDEIIEEESDESGSEEESHKSKTNDKKSQKEEEDIELGEDNDDNLNVDDEENNEKEIARLDQLNELLFCVQGVGKFTDETKTIYEKDSFCEPSLRDIHRFLRNDDTEKPICKQALLNWNFGESDLIPLLLNYENNEKIHQLCLVILVDLTEQLPDLLDERQGITLKLNKLNKFLINSPLIELLSRSLNDASQILKEAQLLKDEIKKEERINRLLKKEQIKTNSYANDINTSNNNNDTINNNNNNDINNNNNNNDINNNVNNNVINRDEEVNQDKEIEIAKMKKKIAEIEVKNQNIVELVLVLLKQIIGLYDMDDLSSSSYNYSTLLTKLVQNKILDAIVYHSNNFEDRFTQKLSGTLLDLIYLLTRIFIPKCLFDLCSNQLGNNKPLTELQKLIQQEELEKRKRRELYSSRPNNFGTRIKVVRPIDKSSFVVSNVNQLFKNQKLLLSEKSNAFGNQLHKGKGKKGALIKNKKIPQSQIAEEVQMINNLRLKTGFSTSVNLTQQSFNDTVLCIKIFFENYMINCLNSLIYFFYFLLGKEDQLEKYDKYYLISVMEFFIEFNRLNEYTRMKEESNDTNVNYPNKNKFNFIYIKECLTSDMINYCYNALYEQVIMNKKTDRKVLLTFPIINYLKQVLYASFDSYKYKTYTDSKITESNDDFNLTLNVIIQDHLLTKDFTKVFKEMFKMFNEEYHPQELLFDLIEFTELYYGTLELFSKKRNLKIKKRKLKKNKKGKDEDEEELYEKYNALLNLNKNGENDDKSISSLNDVDDFIERDLDVNDEAKCLVDYDIIDKIFLIFKQENITSTSSFNLSKRLLDLKNNPKNIIKFITTLLDRIVNKVKYFWIFFQMEYLIIINNLLNDSLFKEDIAFLATKNVLLKIIHEYFKVFKTNKLLSIECLFNFSNVSIAEMIMSNYEYDGPTYNKDDDYINEDLEMNKEFAPEEGEEYYNPNKLSSKDKEWSKEEDMSLINNYFEFETNDNLMIILKNQFDDRTEKDILKRMKKLKVRKGRERAMKKYNKYHKILIQFKPKTDYVANCIIQLEEKAKDEQFKAKINKVFDIVCEQIVSTKNRKELLGKDIKYECVLIPMSNEELDMYQDDDFCEVLRLAGLSRKNDDKRFFYVNEEMDPIDVDLVHDKIESFAKIINENTVDVNPEREEKKEKHKKKHHHKTKKKSSTLLNDYRIPISEKEDKNSLETYDIVIEDKEEQNNKSIDNNQKDNVIIEKEVINTNDREQIDQSSHKKKKKLIKRLKETEMNDIEME